MTVDSQEAEAVTPGRIADAVDVGLYIYKGNHKVRDSLCVIPDNMSWYCKLFILTFIKSQILRRI